MQTLQDSTLRHRQSPAAKIFASCHEPGAEIFEVNRIGFATSPFLVELAAQTVLHHHARFVSGFQGSVGRIDRGKNGHPLGAVGAIIPAIEPDFPQTIRLMNDKLWTQHAPPPSAIRVNETPILVNSPLTEADNFDGGSARLSRPRDYR